jgi:hypothetical protein
MAISHCSAFVPWYTRGAKEPLKRTHHSESIDKEHLIVSPIAPDDRGTRLRHAGIARPCGSVPEVLRNGVSGIIASEFDDLVQAVKKIDSVSREACRKEFETRFTADVMAAQYERIYRELISARRNGSHPRTHFERCHRLECLDPVQYLQSLPQRSTIAGRDFSSGSAETQTLRLK